MSKNDSTRYASVNRAVLRRIRPRRDIAVTLLRSAAATLPSRFVRQRQENAGWPLFVVVVQTTAEGMQVRTVVLPHQALMPGPARLFVS